MKIFVLTLSLTIYSCCSKTKCSSKTWKTEVSINPKIQSNKPPGFQISKHCISNSQHFEFLESFEKIYGIDSALSLLPTYAGKNNIKYFNDSTQFLPVENINRYKASVYCD